MSNEDDDGVRVYVHSPMPRERLSSDKAARLGREAVRGEPSLIEDHFFPSPRIRPHIGTMLANAYSLIAEELRRMYARQHEGEKLSTADIDKLTNSLSRLAREEREQERANDPSDLDDDALVATIVKDPELRAKLRRALREADLKEIADGTRRAKGEGSGGSGSDEGARSDEDVG